MKPLKGEKILVTGAGGFIGSHLSEELVRKNFRVRAFVHYNSMNSWGWLDNSELKNDMEIIAGDIRDADIVRRAARGVKAVVHLAALIGIPYSYYSPEAYLETNVRGALNILQAAGDFGLEKVVMTSTSEIYGTAQSVPMDESHPVNPQSPYAATKASADFVALSFHRSFGLPLTIVRPFNAYGPRQSARAVIPSIISQVLSGREKIQLGALTPTRDLTYVKDTVEGFICAMENPASEGEIINIGSSREISVGALAGMIAEIMGVELEIESMDERKRPPESEVERLRADNSKALSLMGWSPGYGLERGLRETVEWFRENISLYKPGIYNI